ncbi:sensor histidine kinase [Actinomadura rupiterrae]|uniref:sensor histidine kinase n=1 Tax=Actinomadura rupiterrae TaxID=559627 RepID=UPI0020A27320|nr:histidine kinase [Actinomadura rupiterrae]MCP2334749.1 signal transduction histidine kinase [Actinomadura rupiterrae]
MGSALRDRWRAVLRATAVPPPRLSRWAFAADVALALLLAAATVNGTLHVSDVAATPNLDQTGPPGPGPGPGPGPLPPLPPLPPPPGQPGPYMPGTEHVALSDASMALHLLLAVMTALPLVVRRRYPLAALWTVSIATLMYHWGPPLDSAFTFASCVIAAYSAVLYSRYHRAAIASALAVAVLTVTFRHALLPQLRPGLLGFLALIPVGLVANAVHTWQQRVRVLEREREAATRQAVERERARIAQELHDVVTHNVSVMVVQAGAARMVLRDEPDRAEAALRAVESGGRSAMTELRHVMNLLTMDGEPDEADLAPRPGLAQVPALADRVRATGVKVDLTVSGVPSDLPEGMDLAAYRVVQESLTNTVKHAEGARVAIAIEHAPDALTIAITDTGGGASAHSGSGRGLIGLRERLAVYGGTLEAGPHLGGYRVRAVFPAAR